MERVLESRTLARTEQLRAFLRYVCEAELEGRTDQINEHALGVQALGRGAGYSPAEDSCVRSRAYELRSKLRTYYEAEAPNEAVRIELPKGTYVPLFTRAPEPQHRDAASQESTGARLHASTPELGALWGPLLAGDVPLLLTFESRLFFFSPATDLVVRHYRCNAPSDVEKSGPLTAFREQMGETELRETLDYADLGAVYAAFLLGRLLSGTQKDVGLKHSASLDWQDVWNSNVVFVGKANTCSIIRTFLEGKDFYVDEEGVIHNPRPRAGESVRYGSASTHGFGEKHALITRVRGPQTGRYVLILCGSGSELGWALAESVTNPELVRELMSHVLLPSGQYAETFQIVVQATFQANVPVKTRYVTHRLLSTT